MSAPVDGDSSAALAELRFGTDGIRGPVGGFITQEVIARIVAGIIQYCGTPGYLARTGLPAIPLTLVVGGDCRATSDYFTTMASQIGHALGVRVLRCQGYVTTPMLAHAVIDQRAHGGIMVTASHNPADHNGIKFLPWYGGPAMPEDTAAIEGFINSDPPDPDVHPDGEVAPHNPAPAYADRLNLLVDFPRIKAAGLRIAFDALYGAGKGYFRQLMLAHDIPAQVFHGEDDPWMGGAMPDPSAGRLQELSALVSRRGFDLGLATDGDADRFAAVDGRGRYLSPNQCVSVLAHYLITHQGGQGNLARTIATTHRLDQIAAHHGRTVAVTPVGFKFLADLLRRDGSLLMAGEESGGFALRGHVPEKDGLLACFLLLEACATTGLPLHGLVEEVERTYGPLCGTRLDRPMTDAAAALHAWALEQPSLTLAGETFTRSAVDRAEFATPDGSWVLVRPSGTEQLLRIYLETTSEVRLVQLAAAMEALGR
ncbi:MAG TPA: phosphoglucomutase/phosphomannomutase family protein [bacterium]|nr:phosphoglucomutase/phosphomannomutase family protein [bacterium]